MEHIEITQGTKEAAVEYFSDIEKSLKEKLEKFYSERKLPKIFIKGEEINPEKVYSCIGKIEKEINKFLGPAFLFGLAGKLDIKRCQKDVMKRNIQELLREFYFQGDYPGFFSSYHKDKRNLEKLAIQEHEEFCKYKEKAKQ